MPTGTIRALPGLTGRLTIDGETMQQPIISLRSGDSARLRFAVRADDEITPIDLTDALVTFSVSDGSGPEPVIAKHSYDDDEIDLLLAEAGVGEIILRPSDTDALEGQFVFDVQIDRAASETPATMGTGTFTDGSEVATLAGVVFDDVHVGSILVVNGLANGGRATITAVDPEAHTVTTAGRAWAAESTVNVSVLDGDRKTPEGLAGLFIVKADVS